MTFLENKLLFMWRKQEYKRQRVGMTETEIELLIEEVQIREA